MLGILNGDLTEQLTAGHDIAGVLLRCGFLMTLSIGAWQDMRNHRIKLSLIVMSGAGGSVLRCMYIVLDAAILYRDWGRCGEGGWVVFSDIGHLSGGSEKSGFAGRRFGDMLFTIHGFGV